MEEHPHFYRNAKIDEYFNLLRNNAKTDEKYLKMLENDTIYLLQNKHKSGGGLISEIEKLFENICSTNIEEIEYDKNFCSQITADDGVMCDKSCDQRINDLHNIIKKLNSENGEQFNDDHKTCINNYILFIHCCYPKYGLRNNEYLRNHLIIEIAKKIISNNEYLSYSRDYVQSINDKNYQNDNKFYDYEFVLEYDKMMRNSIDNNINHFKIIYDDHFSRFAEIEKEMLKKLNNQNITEEGLSSRIFGKMFGIIILNKLLSAELK